MNWQDEILKLAISVATTVLVPLAAALIVQQMRKVGLVISAEQQAQLEHFAREAIRGAEEKAAQRLKANVPVSSGEKLADAVNAVMVSVPSTTAEEATKVIHAQLPQVGVGAAADLGEGKP